jgi:hypothetical protein
MKFWILLAIAIALILWRQRERFDEEDPPPVCPAGTIFDDSDKCSSTDIAPFECPSEYEITPNNQCKRIGGTETIKPTCSAGRIFDIELAGCITEPVNPSCPGGYTYKNRQCSKNVL